jgi:hypothetical protein
MLTTGQLAVCPYFEWNSFRASGCLETGGIVEFSQTKLTTTFQKFMV